MVLGARGIAQGAAIRGPGGPPLAPRGTVVVAAAVPVVVVAPVDVVFVPFFRVPPLPFVSP